MCLYLHSGKDSTAYPTNELMRQETGLSHNTSTGGYGKGYGRKGSRASNAVSAQASTTAASPR